MLSALSTHHKTFSICNRIVILVLMPCLQFLFLYFSCLSNCTQQKLHQFTHYLLCIFLPVMQLCFFLKKNITPRDHTLILFIEEGEAISQTKQTDMSILPICCSSLGQIHQKMLESLGKKTTTNKQNKKNTISLLFLLISRLAAYTFLNLVNRCLLGAFGLQYQPSINTIP